MLIYEVTLEAESAIAAAVEAHMREEHIPEILATGCFHRIRFDRASPTRFRTSYDAATEADLERYLRQHSSRLRAVFQTHFSTGVTISRETWTALESWGDPLAP
jgi:hypothetical protein